MLTGALERMDNNLPLQKDVQDYRNFVKASLNV